MITCKVSDYLTISCMPGEVECSRRELLEQAFRALYIEDWLESNVFDFKCQSPYYEFIARFGDISLKVAYEHNFKKQGICIEFSGKGVDYYREYLSSKFVGVDLRNACARFVGLCKLGFKTNCSRFDVAFDEIINNGEDVQKCLDLDIIQSALLGGMFVSRFRRADPQIISGEVNSVPVAHRGEVVSEIVGNADSSVPFRVIQSLDLHSGRIGKTVELGRRKSATFIRFYDKLAEQLAHKFEVDKNINSWVRFEIEFKKANAATVFLAYASARDDNVFIEHIRGVALHLLRFVELTNSRKYNCKTAEWWDCFLNRVKSAKLAVNRPKYNKYVRALESQKRQNAASLAALLFCRPQTLVDMFKFGFRKPSKNAQAIVSDYRAIQFLSPDEYSNVYQQSAAELNGLEFWRQFSGFSFMNDETFEKFVDGAVDNFFNASLADIGVKNDNL